VVTLSSVLVLVGVLVGMALIARRFIPAENALASATQTEITQRAERILRLEHETGVVEKHNEWEGCKRCHPLKPPPKAIDIRPAKYDTIERKPPKGALNRTSHYDFESESYLFTTSKQLPNGEVVRTDRKVSRAVVESSADPYLLVDVLYSQQKKEIDDLCEYEIKNYHGEIVKKFYDPPLPSAQPERFQR
jgi:hypothetical protein